MNKAKRGMLIVFEGPDGVGKSTLALSLSNYLNQKGESSKLLAFPGNQVGTLGHLVYKLHHNLKEYAIEQVVPASLQMLHIAAHVDAIERIIIPILAKGENVILDRFWWSTWVYGSTSGVDINSLKLMIEVEKFHWNENQPDLLFLIDSNKPYRKDIPEKEWDKLRRTYHTLANDNEYPYSVYKINNNQSLEDSQNDILNHIEASKKKLSRSNESIHENNSAIGQLKLNLVFNLPDITVKKNITSSLYPVVPTEIYDAYWRFASERQEIFFRRLEGKQPPWSKDPILSKYKFTNAYRASDRVSQYLIGKVLYRGDQSPEELFFRTILFKVFNKIETWELLESELGEVSYKYYSFKHYDEILTKARNSGLAIFSPAYIMPSGSSSFGFNSKHCNFLMLIEKMINEKVPAKLTEMKSMHQAFELLSSYPLMGDFLAYQYVIDLNYSELTNFSEMEFVVPGPGARNGIRKCFADFGGMNEVDLIKLVTDRQEKEFSRLGIEFRSLWGRPLQLIDCQNLFCEIDKYSRVAYPNVDGINKRKRIKQTYKGQRTNISYWYPPKWGINNLIKKY